MALLTTAIPVNRDGEELIIPVTCDEKKLEAWVDLFGDSLKMRISSQISRLLQKTPTNASRISLQFVGDISTITAEDVTNKTALPSVNSMLHGRQTLRGKISSFFRRLFNLRRGRHESRAAEQKINHVVICTFVMIQNEMKNEVDNEV